MMMDFPGVELEGVKMPPGWQYAYGYPRNAGYLAVYSSSELGEESDGTRHPIVDDGVFRYTGNISAYRDLLHLLENAGHDVERLLGWCECRDDDDDPVTHEPTHVLIIRIVSREIYIAPCAEAVWWMRSNKKLLFVPARILRETCSQAASAFLDRYRDSFDEVCSQCDDNGWIKADAGWPGTGYVPCLACNPDGRAGPYRWLPMRAGEMMRDARFDGQQVTAGPHAPQEAVCPSCGEAVVLTNKYGVGVWCYSHLENNEECPRCNEE